MGLYLAVFDDDSEIDGVEVGSYSDFSTFRNAVVGNLEGGVAGSRFPVLILHADCEGKWTPQESVALEKELETISAGFRELRPVPLGAGWQQETARVFGIQVRSLYDCFFDVDGEPLLERLTNLVKLSRTMDYPILFQ